MLTTIPRVKLREVVAEQVKAYIVEQNLKPGDRLPTETELAKQFGVSRLSLREATKSLEYLGILESRPRRGLTVGTMNMEKVVAHLGFHPALQDVSPDQLIGTRVVIETGVMPFVAQRILEKPELYDELNAINDKLRKAKSLPQWIGLDIEFHRAIINASGLTPLTPFTDIIAVFFGQFRESVKKGDWTLGLEDHQKIIDALKAQQPDLAAKIMASHIGFHREQQR
ncbi:FadR/GntR family transcriptional regulator [Planctomicrobium sp. SH668]|uniref:FadR/GntR family transcriptional regulator n=1 Tax=Planctomicrobium sp. SH668 TaxID=3448126 RepID=UPI003F5B74B1